MPHDFKLEKVWKFLEIHIKCTFYKVTTRKVSAKQSRLKVG